MDSLSLSNTNEKLTRFENTEMSTAYLKDKFSRKDDTISNERIQNGDTILDTYEVRSDAISGGMGSVWRVHHQSWNTDLAMKRPQPRFFAEGGDAKKAQFVDECEHWINLGLHPNIVSCYYVREIGGVPTIFSEWMDGGSLSDIIKDGSLYEGTEDEIQERILDIAIQAARGLQYSHENGLIHQDFKPGNLLLTKEWDAKVADFGLAKAKSNLDDKSDTAKTTGYTIAYCPQEQVDREEPQKWMDVYSWALTVLEMYAGKRLWQTGAEAKAHFEEYPAQCAHTIPDKMKKVLELCLIDKKNGFSDIIIELAELYYQETGIIYNIQDEKIAETTDILNNRALSFWDLGFTEQAEEILQNAIREKNDSQNAVFNYALLRWRRGSYTDAECISFLKDHLGEDDDTIDEFVRERGFDDEQFIKDVSFAYGDAKPRETQRIAEIYNTNLLQYIGMQSNNGCWDVPEYFALIRCDEYGRTGEKELQIAIDSSFYPKQITVVEDTAIISSFGKTAFYHFNKATPYYSIEQEDVFFITDNSSRIVKVNAPAIKVGKRYQTPEVQISLYENLQKVMDEKPIEFFNFQMEDCLTQVYLENERVFAIGEDSITVIDFKVQRKQVLSCPGIQSTIFKNNTMYIMTSKEIIALDAYSLSQCFLGECIGYGSFCVTPDEKHLISFENNHLRIYDIELCRCVVDWYEDRFNEWEKVLIRTDNNELVTLHVKNQLYDRLNDDEYYEYIRESYPIPVLGDPCDWRLSKIQSTNERRQARQAFEKLLNEAQESIETGNDSHVQSLLESAYRIQGYEQNDRLRELNQAAGKNHKITDIRYIKKVKTFGLLPPKENRLCIVGVNELLTRFKEPDSGECGYRLIRYKNGEILFSYPAAEDSIFICISRDYSIAVAIEKIEKDSFTIHTMDLFHGVSNRIIVSLSINVENVAGATDGKNILISAKDHEVVISNGTYKIREKSENERHTPMAYCRFSPNSAFFANSYADSCYDRIIGTFIRRISSNAILDCEEQKNNSDSDDGYSAAHLGTVGLDVNDEGLLLAQSDCSTILFYPDEKGTIFRIIAEKSGVDYCASAFINGGSGFVTIGSDGSLTFFNPSPRDYRVIVFDTDPREQIVYEKPEKAIKVDYQNRIHGASEIAVEGEIRFNGDATAFLDADGEIWVIDYRYSSEKNERFSKPLYAVTKELEKPETPVPPNQKSKYEPIKQENDALKKKGFFSRLFGKK